MTTTQLKTVGMHEFRDHLAEHLGGETALAITCHGLIIGYYIPAPQPVSEMALQALEEATQRLQTLLAAQQIDPEDVIHDYTTLRKAHRQDCDATSCP